MCDSDAVPNNTGPKPLVCWRGPGEPVCTSLPPSTRVGSSKQPIVGVFTPRYASGLVQHLPAHHHPELNPPFPSPPPPHSSGEANEHKLQPSKQGLQRGQGLSLQLPSHGRPDTPHDPNALSAHGLGAAAQMQGGVGEGHRAHTRDTWESWRWSRLLFGPDIKMRLSWLQAGT